MELAGILSALGSKSSLLIRQDKVVPAAALPTLSRIPARRGGDGGSERAQARGGGGGRAEDGGARLVGVKGCCGGHRGREEGRRRPPRRISAAPSSAPGGWAAVRAAAPGSRSCMSSHGLKKEKLEEEQTEKNVIVYQKRPKPLWAREGPAHREVPVGALAGGAFACGSSADRAGGSLPRC